MNCPIRISYTLRRGDTFYKIAQRYRTTVEILQMENPHMDPKQLMPGEVITICPGVTSVPRPDVMPQPTPLPEAPPMPQPVPMPSPMPQPVPTPVPMPRPMPSPGVRPVPMPQPVPAPRAVTGATPDFGGMPAQVPVPNAGAWDVQTPEAMEKTVSKPESTVDLHDVMRALWEFEAMWTYDVIISAMDGAPDLAALNHRAIQGNDAIAALFAPFYDPDTSYKLAEYLNRNLAYTVHYAQSVKNNGASVTTPEWVALRQNTEQLLTFLCRLNPGFDCAGLRKQFDRYLEALKNIVNYRKNKQYPEDIAAADEAVYASLQIADILTDGLMKM